MIRGESYYFFRLDHCENDIYPEYRIAKSIEDLSLRFGESYINCFHSITKLNEVTLEHIRAIDKFLFQQIS